VSSLEKGLATLSVNGSGMYANLESLLTSSTGESSYLRQGARERMAYVNRAQAEQLSSLVDKRRAGAKLLNKGRGVQGSYGQQAT